jgi:hypothetical protein
MVLRKGVFQKYAEDIVVFGCDLERKFSMRWKFLCFVKSAFEWATRNSISKSARLRFSAAASECAESLNRI